jgi:hypothetical protein
MSHKGSWSRVNDRKAFANNYDAIFRKKEPYTVDELKGVNSYDFYNQRYSEACPCHESLETVLDDPDT